MGWLVERGRDLVSVRIQIEKVRARTILSPLSIEAEIAHIILLLLLLIIKNKSFSWAQEWKERINNIIIIICSQSQYLIQLNFNLIFHYWYYYVRFLLITVDHSTRMRTIFIYLYKRTYLPGTGYTYWMYSQRDGYHCLSIIINFRTLSRQQPQTNNINIIMTGGTAIHISTLRWNANGGRMAGHIVRSMGTRRRSRSYKVEMQWP